MQNFWCAMVGVISAKKKTAKNIAKIYQWVIKNFNRAKN
jgi:hypothetical protein